MTPTAGDRRTPRPGPASGVAGVDGPGGSGGPVGLGGPAGHGGPAGPGGPAGHGRAGELRDPIADPPDAVSAWNVANALTVLRLALVPVFLVLLFCGGGTDTGWRLAAAGVFTLACVTDRFDGDIARRRGLVTEFGKLADPIADKALVGAALIGLSALDELPWWVTVVILVREVGVTGLRFWVIRHGVLPASRGGKLKTLLQTVAIGLFVLPPYGWLRDAAWVVMIAAIGVALVTGADYVHRALVLRRTVVPGAAEESPRPQRRCSP